MPDMPNTSNSLFGVCHARELGNVSNPICCKGNDGKAPYYGAMQHSAANIKVISLYTLRYAAKGSPEHQWARSMYDNPDQVQKWADRNIKKPADCSQAPYAKYQPKADYLDNFVKNGQCTLQMQREVSCKVYGNYWYSRAKKTPLTTRLRNIGINPLDIKPATWEILNSSAIAVGNCDKLIDDLVNNAKARGVEYVNSRAYIDHLKVSSSAFSSKYGTTKIAMDLAYSEVGKNHSLATAQELAWMLGDDRITQDYIERYNLWADTEKSKQNDNNLIAMQRDKIINQRG